MTDVIGTEQVAKATALLQRYKTGKAALDKRIVDNELWFRMQHWANYQNEMMEGKPKPSSGWLFNSIANKHADAMDNYPEPNVLPRAADDEQTAKVLSKILPVLLEQAEYEQVYSDTWWRKLKQGTGVKGIFWDPGLRNGVGDISIKSMDLLMMYWEPGVMDIQDSPNLFSLAVADNEQLKAQYPQLEGHTGSTLEVAKYIHDQSIDTSDKSVVVDWYYKKAREDGPPLLHYCKFCNGVVLYASENDPALADRGFYDHGKYPFVFDTLFVEEDSPAGFGYIDVMKDTQTAIDEMNAAMDENVKLSAKARYIIQDGAGINEQELADFSKDIVHAAGRDPAALTDSGAGGQPDHLPGRESGRAEGDQRQPGRFPGRNHQRLDRGFCHCGAAGSGLEALPGHAEKRLPGLCKGMLFHHRPDAAVLRREPGLPHYRRQRPAGVCAVLRGNAAAPAGWHDRRGGAGQPRAGVRHHGIGCQEEHLQPPFPERDGKGVLPDGAVCPGQR